MGETKQSSNGVGFFSLLGLLFILLKLTDVIDWSWWWVTLPLWGGFALIAIIIIIPVFLISVATIIKILKDSQ